MKVRPIIFSDAMVRALLEGRKTQTRRILKRQPPAEFQTGDLASIINGRGRWAISRCDHPGTRKGKAWPPDPEPGFLCPYGDRGDALYVREAWADLTECFDRRSQRWNPDTGLCETRLHEFIWYRADGDQPDPGNGRPLQEPWKPSIHMPRRHSRLTLHINRVRLEQLNSISESDARAEGVEQSVELAPGEPAGVRTPKPGFYVDGFAALWDSIHGEGAWTRNPWVWVLDFEVHRQNVDTLPDLLP